MERNMQRTDVKTARRARKRRRRSIIQSLACLVVFCTTYALILPALTLEKPTYCGQKEHKHTDKCYTMELVCGKEESEGHTHDDSCYTEHQNLICGLEETEGHTHTEACYQTYDKLVCDLEENDEHTHGPECYEQVTELVCSLEETEGHTHTDACYETVRELSCGLEEGKGHTHTEKCYKKVLTCKQEEHEHSLECYSNPKADLETEAEWEKDLPKEEELTGVWAEDLLKVAETQLNYAESSRNYHVVDEEPMGYTRYGAYYGMPYEDWCAMYIGFCLHYAGIPKDAMPRASSCTKWVKVLTEKEMYIKAEDGQPRPGDLVFFDVDKEKGPDHVGIVVEVDEKDGIKTIEGNCGNKVAHCQYKWDDKTLYGYGLLPENPNPEGTEVIIEEDPEKDLEKEEEPAIVEFTGETDTVTVRVEAPEGAFPEGTTMEVSTVAAEDVMEAVSDAVDGEVARVDAVDIKFIYNNEEIEPALPIQVYMTPIERMQEGTPKIVHVQDDGSASEIDHVTTPEGEEGLKFEADSFSVYAIVYTVDFEYSVDGKVFLFSLPGGGFVNFTQLVEALEIADDAAEFVANVQNVEFSRPELVWVGKSEADTTVGALKEAYGLECQYSTELTKEQIVEIDAQTVKAGDWALISMLPFDTEESLMVTMNDGEQFTVKVTDYQISANVLTADGKTYKVTVTFDDDAEIPEGTELVVKEIEKESNEYLQYVGRTWIEINRGYFEQEELKEKDEDFVSQDIPLMNIDQARFFDIALMNGSQKVEPKAPVQVDIRLADGLGVNGIKERFVGVSHFVDSDSAVSVKMDVAVKRNSRNEQYGAEQETEAPGLDTSVELIDDVLTEKDADGRTIRFIYDQDSFSAVGIYIGHETRNPEKRLSAPSLKLRTGETKGTTTLETPDPQKHLTPNKKDGKEDGTYTLSLSVTGDSVFSTETETQKSNVLFIMDRSSSMNYEVSEAYVRFASEEEALAAYNSGTTVYAEIDGSYSHPALTYIYGDWYYRQGFTPYNYDPSNGLYYRLAGTRLAQEQAALANLLPQLMGKNSGEGNNDNVEIAIISFATFAGKDQTRSYYKNAAGNLVWSGPWEGTEVVTWQQGTDTSTLMNAVNDPDMARGTNWEEALKYAKDVMDAKKQADEADPDHPEEDYYVVFLTDGAPTATTWSSSQTNKSEEYGAYYYSGAPGYDNQGRARNSNGPAYDDAKDDALALVADGYRLYNIFTYGSGDDFNYMVRLTNYAYSNGTDDTNTESQYVNDYFTNATTTDKLVEAFQNIFSQIAVQEGHIQVKITDGLRQDALTSSFVNGKPSGVTYTVAPKDNPNTPIYTVTATVPEGSDEPVVTFKIGNNEYSTTDGQVTKHVKVPVEGDPLASYDAGTYYSVTVDGVEYKMALAAVAPTADENVDTLTWDLSPVGMLMDDCIYKADFIVWPNQDAYDYVAALNNGLTEIKDPDNAPIPVVWNQAAATEKTDSKGKTYYQGGCEKYPSIVYYPDPEHMDDPENHIYYGTFSVLTNTDQQLDYSIVTTKNGEVVSVEPQEPIPMPLPDPMPLKDTSTFVLKKWSVERDAGVLAQYLYDLNGKPKKFKIKFDIYQGEVTDSSTPYKSLIIGWDDTAGPEGAYVWEGQFVEAEYGDTTYTIGTHWKADFDISAGLMLSDARMTELKLNKNDYSSAQYGNTTYYILEAGHDYTIKEDGENIGYEFDFDSPVYHPMLVDGEMKNVEITKNGSNYTIGSIAPTPLESLGLKIENKLRAYLHLNKVVIGKDGKPLPNDKTRFEYTINIHSPIKLEGTHIPWYAVNDLFYHDKDFNYYQADPIFEGENQIEGVLSLKTESGYECQATCEGMFDPDIEGPTTIHYTDEDGEPQEIELYGNITKAATNQQDIQATLKINQNERLTIANIPAESTFNITETNTDGYELVGIVADQSATQSGATVSGTIVQNADNNVTYKNKVKSGSLKLTKIVQIDGASPVSDKYSLVDGDYIFTVENAENNTFEVNKYVQITVQNGVAVSYKIADTKEALSEAVSVSGSWAVLTDLASGDYVITETAERNGLLLTDIARGDASETAVDLDNSQVTVHVTADDTAAAQTNAQATFTNNYYNNDGPDRIALDIVKTFNGLNSEADLPDDFRVVICYTVPGSTDPIEIELKKGQNETIETADGEHVKIEGATDGFTLNWHITNIPSSATSFKIKETNYGSVTGYNFTAATLDGADITATAGSWHDMSVTAPTAHLSNVTNERRTSDSGSNVEFVLEDGDILLSKLTANQGTLVISKKSLNTLERKAVELGWPKQGGFKTPPRYFSIEEHQSGFKYGGKEVTFSVRKSDGKTIVTFTQNASAQEDVFAVTYDSQSSLNNAALTNTYEQIKVTLELIKVDNTDMTKPLEKAQFTIKKLDPEGKGTYLTGTGAVEKTSENTDDEGKTTISGLTDGYYEISETKIPAGYILADSGKFYIKIVNGKITRIVETEDDPSTTDKDESEVRYWAEATNNTGNIRFVSTQPAIPDDPETENVVETAEAKTTYKVGNTPGKELPHTGGMGTRIFYALGMVLVLGASIIVFSRKRTGK